MRIKHHLPEPGTLANAVCHYLQAHPDEVLGVSAAAALSHADLATVPAALAGAVDCGLLAIDGRGTVAIYSAGPNLADSVLADQPPASRGIRVRTPGAAAADAGRAMRPVEVNTPAAARAPAVQGMKHGIRNRALVNLAAVPVQYGPAPPATGLPKHQSRTGYDVLFDRLDRVGAYCDLPMPMHAAAARAAQVYRKTHAAQGVRLSLRKTPPHTFRLTRVA